MLLRKSQHKVGDLPLLKNVDIAKILSTHPTTRLALDWSQLLLETFDIATVLRSTYEDLVSVRE
jgi:hypothetical protein